MFQFKHNPGRIVLVGEKEMLFFSGYAYLGMNHNASFIQKITEGIQLYGAVYPSARISNTQLELYAATEKYLSSLTQTTDTVLFQSGFTAGKAAIEIIPVNSAVFRSPVCHPAIKNGNNSTLSFSDWTNETTQSINNNSFATTPVIVSDAVNPLTAEVYDFSFLNNIHQPIICIIDDSHGIGILGNNGEGISSRLPQKENIEYIITYSLSKAINVQAGAVSCSNINTASKLRATSWYAATTPPAPSMLYALLQSTEIYQQQRKSLQENIHFLQQLFATNSNIKFHPELPVFLFQENLDEAHFAKHNIIISSFAYPNPQGRKINRAVVSALHTQNDLQRLAETISK
jgi:7-keto-8-aminopelargonate synthetase-like enzyme